MYVPKWYYDELLLTQQKDAYGNLIDEYNVTVLKERNGMYAVGTNLIRDIINSEHVCMIQVTNEKNKTSVFDEIGSSTLGMGADAYIYFNADPLFNSFLTEYVRKDGGIGTRYEAAPPEIMLGHELIHAMRAMAGKLILDRTGVYEYKSADGWFGNKGRIKQKIDKIEELETTGISYMRPDGVWINAADEYTTENALRREHGYGRRVKYQN